MMPEIDGLEVCRKVREMSATIPPYLILLTAMSTKDDIVKGIEAGANDCLSKPFHRDELKVRVGVGVQMVERQKTLTEHVQELETALSQVAQLRGLLPICSYCKKIRDDQNYWQKVESYFSERTAVQFSHGICPTCYEDVKNKLVERRQQKSDLEMAGTPGT
ncbi:MAG: response regulator [Acidobacteriota bacterium]